MCGRFTLRTPADAFAKYFLAGTVDVCIPSLKPRFNIAPTQMIAAVRWSQDNQPEFCELRWGLIPSWAKDKKIANALINARGESLGEKPAFRGAFKRRRCAILADGFYEWRRDGKRKRPSYIFAKGHQPFCFAGLWEHWESPQETIESATIVTTAANEFLKDLHDRMPVILPAAALRTWLEPTTDPDSLHDLIRSAPPEFLDRYEVCSDVNSPRTDQSNLIEPLPHDLFGE